MSETIQDQEDKSGSQETGGEGTGTNGEAQAEGTASNALGVEVPDGLKEKEKELLKAFHSKTQALADKEKSLEAHKHDAETLYELVSQPWFKDAYKQFREGNNSQKEMSDEEWDSLRQDKRAFNEFLSKRDKATADSLRSEFRNELGKLSKEQKEIQSSLEFKKTAEEFGEDFVSAQKDGSLKEYLDEGHNLRRSYQLFKSDRGEVAKKSEKQSVDSKRSGTVEKNGLSSARGGKVYKAGSLDAALNQIFDAAARGEKDYRVSKE